MTKNDGGPAFPVHGGHHPDDDPRNHALGGGMSLRDWFAGQALAALIRNSGRHFHSTVEEVDACRAGTAEMAYSFADKMLSARKGGPDDA